MNPFDNPYPNLSDVAKKLSDFVDELKGSAANGNGFYGVPPASDTRKEGAPGRAPLKALTPGELTNLIAEPIESFAHLVGYRGMLTLIDGLPKTSGKTTLLLSAVRATLTNSEFLSRPTKKVRTLIVSEENTNTLRLALARAGLDKFTDGIYLLPRNVWAGIPWFELVGRIAELCIELKIDWLILDTFYAIAGLVGDDNLKPGPVLKAINPIIDLTGKLNIATTITRHERKSGGAVGESGIGSIQLTGSVDNIVQIRRVSDAYTSSTRQIEAIGRIDAVSMTIELREKWYVETGYDETPKADTERERVNAAITADRNISKTKLGQKTGVTRNRVEAVARAASWKFNGKPGRKSNCTANCTTLWTKLDETFAPEWHDKKDESEYPN